jgi:hypothetical protein
MNPTTRPPVVPRLSQPCSYGAAAPPPGRVGGKGVRLEAKVVGGCHVFSTGTTSSTEDGHVLYSRLLPHSAYDGDRSGLGLGLVALD